MCGWRARRDKGIPEQVAVALIDWRSAVADASTSIDRLPPA